jgi:DNA-directed RNA polymerase subunit RPC12/RpoP
MIGIGAMMLWGHWWPGILVLIGISIVMGAVWNAGGPREMEDAPMPPVMPPPPAPEPIYRTQPAAAPAPVSANRRIDLLPATCPRCGAPVRSPEVRWRGESFAACAYCGSNVIIKNARQH